jgi:hypothetical protein
VATGVTSPDLLQVFMKPPDHWLADFVIT